MDFPYSAKEKMFETFFKLSFTCYLLHLSIPDTSQKNHNQNFTALPLFLTHVTSITVFTISFLIYFLSLWRFEESL